MSICIWRAMKSAGEPPVWGENVNVFSPELVEKEDVRCVAVYFYFPLTKASVILHMSSLQSSIIPNRLLSRRNSSFEKTKTSLYKCLLLLLKLAVALYGGETLITLEVTMFCRTCSPGEVEVKGQTSTSLKNLLLLHPHQLSWSQGNQGKVFRMQFYCSLDTI